MQVFKYVIGLLMLNYGLPALVASIWNAVDTYQDIADGRLVYERTLGWIDLTHANVTGATRLLLSLQSADFSTPLVYEQCMECFGTRACSSVTYSLRDNIRSEIGTARTAEYIYRTVSLTFEEMQRKVNKLDKLDSSLRLYPSTAHAQNFTNSLNLQNRLNLQNSLNPFNLLNLTETPPSHHPSHHSPSFRGRRMVSGRKRLT